MALVFFIITPLAMYAFLSTVPPSKVNTVFLCTISLAGYLGCYWFYQLSKPDHKQDFTLALIGFILLVSILMCSCSKPNDISLARPIKKDVTAPKATITYDISFVTINATDDMGLKAVYYYENNVLSRTFTTSNTPGATATNWTYTFPFTTMSPCILRVMVVDLAGNYVEVFKTI